MKLVVCTAALLVALAAAAPSLPKLVADDGQVKAVTELDIPKFMGVWHQIARKPQFFENDCASKDQARYTLNAESKVDVHNTCLDKNGGEIVADGLGEPDGSEIAGQLRVTFAPKVLRGLPFVWGPFWVLDIDADYSRVLIGEPSKKFLWILSRNESLSEPDFEELKHIATSEGYDLSDLIVSGTVSS